MEMMKLSRVFLAQCLLFSFVVVLNAPPAPQKRKAQVYHYPQGPGSNPVDDAVGEEGEFEEDAPEDSQGEGDSSGALDGFSQGTLSVALTRLNDLSRQLQQGIKALDQKLAAENDASATTVVDANEELSKAQKLILQI